MHGRALLTCAAMLLSDFDYALPDELIARYPCTERRRSRLLLLDAAGHGPEDRQFGELPSLLREGDLLVLNNTRVVKARLRGRKQSGGKVELLIERALDVRRALAHVRASKPSRAGTLIEFAAGVTASVVGRSGNLFELEFSAPLDDLLDAQGEVPLPPYLNREAETADDERYQTVYAEQPGAVAAPTAGLHFDHAMFAELAARNIAHTFVTLHVGAGTFQTLKQASVAENRLHEERMELDATASRAILETRQNGGRIVAVGTTSVRTLETAARRSSLKPCRGETDLFIKPGFEFRAVDAMLTNFHLPQSSLLMLVAAFVGRERILDAYRHAVDRRYRFFSYGDAMLLVARAAQA